MVTTSCKAQAGWQVRTYVHTQVCLPGHAHCCTLLGRLSKLALWYVVHGGDDVVHHRMTVVEFEVWQKYPVQLFADAAACIVMLQFCRCLQLSVLDAPPSPSLPPPPVGISSKVVLHCLRH